MRITTIQKKKKLIFTTIFIFGVLLILQIFLANRNTGKGLEMASLQSQTESLARENLVLREKIASSTSLQKLSSESTFLGLVKPETIIYLDVASTPVAFAN